MRTTSPISPTEMYAPSVHAPLWSSRVTTPAIPSGWATQRRRLCGTMTLSAPIGGVPTRTWKGRRRPTCCQLPTRMNFSAQQTWLWRTCRSKGLKVRETDAEERKCSQTLFSAHSVSRHWHAECQLYWTCSSMSARVWLRGYVGWKASEGAVL